MSQPSAPDAATPVDGAGAPTADDHGAPAGATAMEAPGAPAWPDAWARDEPDPTPIRPVASTGGRTDDGTVNRGTHETAGVDYVDGVTADRSSPVASQGGASSAPSAQVTDVLSAASVVRPTVMSPSVQAAPAAVPAGSAARTSSGPPPPATVGPLVSALRRPFLVLLPLLAMLVPSVALAELAPASFGASSQILVGRVDVESTAVPGFVAANQQLAGVYSRLVSTELVAGPVARELDLAVDDVLSGVTASPVPESSILLVEAEAATQAGAVALAATAAEQLVVYVQQTSVAPAGGDATLQQFREASTRLVGARLARDTAQTALTEAQTGPAAALTAAQEAFVAAQATLDATQLEVDTLSGTFQSDLRGSGERNSLQVITSGVGTGSDRLSRLQLAVAASLLIGLTTGVGLATLVENRSAVRALRRRTTRDAA